LTDWAHKEPI